MKKLSWMLPVLITLQLQSCYTIHQDDFFYPEKLVRLSDNISFNEVYFNVDDSVSINAWYFTKKDADAVILVLHGNGGNLYTSPTAGIVNSLSALNVNIFAIDYRGYGRSSGVPSLNGIYDDVEGALGYLQKHNPDNLPIIVYGFSMGTIPAVPAATDSDAAGLILEGAISSSQDFLDYAKSKVWWLSLVSIKYDTSLEFDNVKEIRLVRHPVLMIRGKKDFLPESMSHKLYDAVKDSTKYYWLVEKGAHCDTYKIQPQDYLKRISDFVEVCKELKHNMGSMK